MQLVYAIGFERRQIPIAGLPADYGYDRETGEVAPGLFGIGMAFPGILRHTPGRAEFPRHGAQAIHETSRSADAGVDLLLTSRGAPMRS